MDHYRMRGGGSRRDVFINGLTCGAQEGGGVLNSQTKMARLMCY